MQTTQMIQSVGALCLLSASGFVSLQQKVIKSSLRADPKEYFFGKPGELDADLRLLGTSRRRIAQYFSLALGLGLAGDFLGSTSALLSTPLLADFARNSKLDTYYVVQNFKRYVDDENHLECLYPSDWLGDRAVYLRRNAIGSEAFLLNRKGKPLPLVGFAPPQKKNKVVIENLSIFRSELPNKVLNLRSALGNDPTAAAQRLLDTAIAPPSSGKTSQLISASERLSDGAFSFEYTLTLPPASESDNDTSQRTFHNLAVVLLPPKSSDLFTFTILASESLWPQREASFRIAADSFRLLSS